MTQLATSNWAEASTNELALSTWSNTACRYYEFLQLRNNNRTEENRAFDLFYALWIPDLFMKRFKADEQWSMIALMSAQVSLSVTAKNLRCSTPVQAERPGSQIFKGYMALGADHRLAN